MVSRVYSCGMRSLVLAVVAACAPGAGSTPPPVREAPRVATTPTVSSGEASWEQPLDPETVAAPAAAACGTLACVQMEAEAAGRRGALDVAAAYHGRAFALAPEAASLARWIDALVAVGDVTGAQRALTLAEKTGSGLRAEVERHRGGLAARFAGAPSSEGLAAAYAAEAAGRFDEAAAGFVASLTPAAAPEDLIHAAELLGHRGDAVAAARLRSAARVRLRERVELHTRVTAREFTYMVEWRGEELMTLRSLDILGPEDPDEIAMLLVHPRDPRAPRRQILLPRDIPVFALSDDGRTIVRNGWRGLVVQDVGSGAELRQFAEDRFATKLAVIGDGEAMQILGANGGDATLWNARGEELARYPAMVAHDGRPVVVGALALATTRVALGGWDGKIRIFDRADEGTRTIAAEPDENNWVIALRFAAGGERLIAVHHDGDITTWDARNGAQLHRVSGRCSEAELVAMSRVDSPESRELPTDWQREKCHTAYGATIAPDGTLVAIDGWDNAIRVRDTRTGEARGYLSERYAWNHVMAMTHGGALALVDREQAITVWRPGEAAVMPVTPGKVPAECWSLAAGRYLWSQCSGWSRVWDLVERRSREVRRDLGERLVALSDDGRYVAVGAEDWLELRSFASRATIARVPIGTMRVGFAGDHAWIRGWKDGSTFVADLVRGTVRRVELSPGEEVETLSPDGRRLVTYRGEDRSARTLRDLDGGGVLRVLAGEVGKVAFSPDGAWVAWLVDDGVHALRLDDVAARERRLAAAQRPSNIVMRANGEVWFVSDGQLVRWQPATGRRRSERLFDSGSGKLSVAEGGRYFSVQRWDFEELWVADGRPRRVARVYGLANGGWVAISSSGAMDGSPNAVEQLVTHAGDVPERLYPGELAWDAVHVPGLVSRALAGEDVVLPVSPPVGATEKKRARFAPPEARAPEPSSRAIPLDPARGRNPGK